MKIKCTGPCGQELELNEENFIWRTDSNTWRKRCRKCSKKYMDDYYQLNKEYIAERTEEYYAKHPEKRKEISKKTRTKNREKILKRQHEYEEEHKKELAKKRKLRRLVNLERERKRSRNWYYNNKEKRNETERNRRQNDPNFRARKNFSRLFLLGSKKNSVAKKDSCFKILQKYISPDYTFEKYKQYIESLFELWMNWENQGAYKPETWNDNNPSTWTWQLDHIIPQSELSYDSYNHPNFKKCWALENLRPYSAKQNLLDGAKKTRHKKQRKNK